MARFNPSLGGDQFPRLSTQIQEKFLENRQTSEIYDRKNRWREEIEGIVKSLYPSSQLVLSGSSANGFGSVHSDIDLVLCFDGAAPTGPYMLRKIESLFTSNRRRFQTGEVWVNLICYLKEKSQLHAGIGLCSDAPSLSMFHLEPRFLCSKLSRDRSMILWLRSLNLRPVY